jgi:hypothetical protein
MSSESDLATLIAAIYEAGMDFSLWPYVLGQIASAFGVPSASSGLNNLLEWDRDERHGPFLSANDLNT